MATKSYVLWEKDEEVGERGTELIVGYQMILGHIIDGCDAERVLGRGKRF